MQRKDGTSITINRRVSSEKKRSWESVLDAEREGYRYISYDAGEGAANDIKITFRSIKTRIDIEGKPYDNSEYQRRLEEQPEETEDPASTSTPDTATVEPYYPFTQDYYYTEYASVRREALAQKFGGQPYSTYKAKSTVLRMQDWANSPELHDITELPAVETAETGFIGPQPLSQPVLSFDSIEREPEDIILEVKLGTDTTYETTGTDSTNASGTILKQSLNEPSDDNIKIVFPDKIPPTSVYKFEKESTKIRNLYKKDNNYFYPIDPTFDNEDDPIVFFFGRNDTRAKPYYAHDIEVLNASR